MNISKTYELSATICELGNPYVVLHAPWGLGIATKFLMILSAIRYPLMRRIVILIWRLPLEIKLSPMKRNIRRYGMKLTNEKKRDTSGGRQAPILPKSQLQSLQYYGSDGGLI